MGEKRRYLRFDILIDAVYRTRGVLKNICIKNFSSGGVGFSAKSPLVHGENVDAEIYIPGDNIPVIFQGQITWVREAAAPSGIYEGGIRFNMIKDDDKNRMLEYIYNNWIKPTEDKGQKETEEK